MRLVVDNDDIFEAHQFLGNAPDHLALGFLRHDGLVPPLQKGAPDLVDFQQFLQLEGVVVRDDDLGLVDVLDHVAGNEFPRAVIAINVVREKDAQPILDRDAGRNYEEPARKEIAGWGPNRVHGLPGDQHSHDSRLASAGRHLHGETKQIRIGLLVGAEDMFPDMGILLLIACDLGQPDDGLGGLHLTEERTHPLEGIMSPMVQETRRGRCHAPGGGIRVPPLRDMGANLVDDRGRVVFLLVRGKPVVSMKVQARLALVGISALSLPGTRDRRNQLRLSASVTRRLVQRLSVRVQRVMPRRLGIGRVQDRLLEERTCSHSV